MAGSGELSLSRTLVRRMGFPSLHLVSFPPKALPIPQERGVFSWRMRASTREVGERLGPRPQLAGPRRAAKDSPCLGYRRAPQARRQCLPSAAPGGSVNQTQQSWRPNPFSYGDSGHKRMLLGTPDHLALRTRGGRHSPPGEDSLRG